MNAQSPSAEEAWPIIDLCLRLHSEQLRDLYVRWQQIEAKANAVVASAGIVLAALAVLLQVGSATGGAAVLICVGGLFAIVAIALAVWSQQVVAFRAPPSSRQMQKVLVDWLEIVGEKDPSRVLGELGPVWDQAIGDVEDKLPRKSAWVAKSQFALGGGALFFLLALTAVSKFGG